MEVAFPKGNRMRFASAGSSLTDAAKVTGRFRRIDYGHLEIDLTVDLRRPPLWLQHMTGK